MFFAREPNGLGSEMNAILLYLHQTFDEWTRTVDISISNLFCEDVICCGLHTAKLNACHIAKLNSICKLWSYTLCKRYIANCFIQWCIDIRLVKSHRFLCLFFFLEHKALISLHTCMHPHTRTRDDCDNMWELFSRNAVWQMFQ